MKKILLSLAVAFFLIAGCVGPQVDPNAVTLGVKFSWKGIKKGSKKSPKIIVTKIPRRTVKLKIKLKDLDVTSWNHGGGEVAYKPTKRRVKVIRAGALKKGYNGPNPPGGSHRYQFTVHAIDAKGVIVGIGKAMKKYP